MNPRDYSKIFNSFSFNAADVGSDKKVTTNPDVQTSEHYTPTILDERPVDEYENPYDEVTDPEDEETEIALPDKYSGLSKFYKAIDSDTIKTKEAKYALLAQMGLESSWGKKSKYFNYGNITTGSNYKGDYYKGGDKNAQGEAITQKFRRYNSVEEFYNDYINLIDTLYPDAYAQLTADEFDIDKFSHGLRNGRAGMYAESPIYEERLRDTYNSVVNSMTPKQKVATTTRKNGGILYKI